MEDFADLIYNLRTRKGKFVSQTKLATLSGYTQTYISLIETERVNPSKRCKRDLLQALGIDSPNTYIS
ncbi:helix-turn-helix domain-containing protein [Candidatus Curtissbacteria bacterium]|nr:helix-turn-helix domain-containing protein [Candidatus Curtissbacteria bacterium]